MRRRRGFVLIMAIALLGLVAAALALLATIAVNRMKHARNEQADAQARQLLIFGQAYARGHLDELAAKPTTRTLALPAELKECALGLSSRPGEANTLIVQIDASERTRHASQQLVYSHSHAQGWKLQSATLSD
jgi:type II secretory pathway pseudopilin PulG